MNLIYHLPSDPETRASHKSRARSPGLIRTRRFPSTLPPPAQCTPPKRLRSPVTCTKGRSDVTAPRSSSPASDPSGGGQPEPTGSVDSRPLPSTMHGWVFFAGIIMILIGFFHAFEGLIGIFKDHYYLVTKNGLVISVSYTTWGWILLIFGVIVLLAGFGVMTGALWARIVGIIVAGISMIVNLAFFQALPLLAVVIIAMDVVIIYALAVHGRELKA